MFFRSEQAKCFLVKHTLESNVVEYPLRANETKKFMILR